jgi:hypothetical protein
MTDVSIGVASTGPSDGVADSGFCPPAPSPPDVADDDSASPSLSPSWEDSIGGKGIGLSVITMHRAIEERGISGAGEGCRETGSWS